MPISRAIALTALLTMGACDGGLGFGAPPTVAMFGGTVTVAGPPGYCVDRRLTRESTSEGFVVLGPCNAFASGAKRPDGLPAILTATVSADPAGIAPSPDGLESFVRSQTGRAALSRVGRAETVTVLDTRRAEDLLLLYISDTSSSEVGLPTASEYWRAVLNVNGRLVTATVMSFANRPLSPDQGFRKLGDFVRRLQNANSRSRPN